MSLRLVKSPDAPKITITQGSPGRPTGSSITRASSPDPLDLGLWVISDAGSDCLAALSTRLPSVVLARPLRPAVRQGVQQLIEGFGEQAHSLFEQFLGNLLHRDIHLRQNLHGVTGTLEVFFKAGTYPSMVAERLQCCWRHGIDGIGTNQFLDIHHVTVMRVLGTGTGPQDALFACPLGCECLPARSLEDRLVALVRELAVGDGHLAKQAAQQGTLLRSVGGLQPSHDLRVDGRVDTADEEARHAGDLAHIATLRGTPFQTCDIGLRDALVDLLGEQQGDIDVDALGEELFDGGEPRRRGWHLNQHIRPLDSLPKTPGLSDGALCIMGEMRRNLQADVSV